MNTPNEMNKSNHTELPWRLRDSMHINSGHKPIIFAQNDVNAALEGKEFAEYPTPTEAAANAALIVHRVNNWDKLVEALEEIAKQKPMVTHIDGEVYGNSWEIAIAKGALKLAKEGI